MPNENIAVVQGIYDAFGVEIDEIIDGGDTVVALGHYRGTYLATGKPQRTQLAHIWRIVDGKAIGFQQYADTLHMAKVTGVGL